MAIQGVRLRVIDSEINEDNKENEEKIKGAELTEQPIIRSIIKTPNSQQSTPYQGPVTFASSTTDDTKEDSIDDIDDIDDNVKIQINNSPGQKKQTISLLSIEERRAGNTILKNVHKCSIGYRWKHYQEYTNKTKLNFRYKKIALVLSALTTLLASVSALGKEDKKNYDPYVFLLLSLFLSFFTTIFNGIIDQMDPEKSAEAHKKISDDYKKLIDDINYYFAFNIQNAKYDFESFYKNIIEKQQELSTRGIIISPGVINEYNKKTKDDYKFEVPKSASKAKRITDTQKTKTIENDVDIFTSRNFEMDRWNSVN